MICYHEYPVAVVRHLVELARCLLHCLAMKGCSIKLAINQQARLGGVREGRLEAWLFPRAEMTQYA